MKEKKDKSQKKFNIVDFAIIAIVVLLIAGVIWKLSSATKSAHEEAAVQEEITLYETSAHMRFTVECVGILNDAANVMINSADTQLNNNYQDLAAYIVDRSIRPNTYKVTAADGTIMTVEDPETCIVTFVIEGYFDEEESTENMAYKIGTQEVRIGKGYVVKTKSIETSGYVTAMEVVNE